VLGALVYENGSPAVDVPARLIAADANPLQPQELSAVDTTDSLGQFVLNAWIDGNATINVLARDEAMQVLVPRIAVSGNQEYELGSAVLLPPASILVPITPALRKRGGYLFIPGTGSFLNIDSLPDTATVALMPDVPQATGLRVLITSPGTVSTDSVLADSIAAVSADTGIVPGALPAPWRQTAISEQPRGGALYADSGFTVSAGGPDIWNEQDGFHFVWQPAAGDISIEARIVELEYTDRYCKAGVMIRSSLDPGSPNAGMFIEWADPALYPDSNSRIIPPFTARLYPDSLTSVRFPPDPPDTTTIPGRESFPLRVKLERKGERFEGYLSKDGTVWKKIGSTALAMPDSILVGIAATSHDISRIGISRFDNVRVTTYKQ
jgi:hypothetical protein